MKKILFLLLVITCTTQLDAKKFYSLLDRTRVIKINLNQSNYKISQENIIKNSIHVRVDGEILLKNIEFKVDYSKNRIEFIKKIRAGKKVIVDL